MKTCTGLCCHTICDILTLLTSCRSKKWEREGLGTQAHKRYVVIVLKEGVCVLIQMVSEGDKK